MFKEKEIAYHLADAGAKIWVTADAAYTDVAKHAGVERVITAAELSGLLAGSATTYHPARRVAGRHCAPGLHLGHNRTTQGRNDFASNIAFNVEVFRDWMRIGPDDVILGLAPLFHITGLVPQLGLCYAAGVPLMLFHRFDAAEVLRLCRKWKPTFCVAAITAYIALMNDGGECPGLLPKCYSGGAPVAPSLTERFEAHFGTYIHNIYGLTESTSPSHATPLGARAPVDPASGALSIGLPIPNCEAKVISTRRSG